MEAARKTKLGQRWLCFKCNTRFYDMNKPQPICPKCQTDQHESPEFQKPAKKRGTKKAAAPKKEVVTPVEEVEDPREEPEVEDDFGGGASEEADFDDLDDLEIEDTAGGEDENVSVEVEDD